MFLRKSAPAKCCACKYAVLKVFNIHDVKPWCSLNYFIVTDPNFAEVVESCDESTI